MLKEIALEYDDVELYKLACELEKDADLKGLMAVREGLSHIGSSGSLLQTNVSDVASSAVSKLKDKLKPLAFKTSAPAPIIPRRAIAGGGPFAVSKK